MHNYNGEIGILTILGSDRFDTEGLTSLSTWYK